MDQKDRHHYSSPFHHKVSQMEQVYALFVAEAPSYALPMLGTVENFRKEMDKISADVESLKVKSSSTSSLQHQFKRGISTDLTVTSRLLVLDLLSMAGSVNEGQNLSSII